MVSVVSLGLVQIWEWITQNWQLAALITTAVIILGVSGSLNRVFQNAINGIKEATTPTGFIILLVLVYLVYLMYQSIVETI